MHEHSRHSEADGRELGARADVLELARGVGLRREHFSFLLEHDPGDVAWFEITAAAAPNASGGEMVKCAGINACQGKGQCGGASAGHACAGKNACKGKGWVKVSKADCTAKGGKPM